MEDLLNEMEEYQELLQAQAKDLMKRIIRANGGTQDKAVREFTNTLTSTHRIVNTDISLIEYQIDELKKSIIKGKA